MALDTRSMIHSTGFRNLNVVPSRWQRSGKSPVKIQASPASGALSLSSDRMLKFQGLSGSSGAADHRRVVTPAVAHHDLVRTPLSAPIVQPSHQMISIPLGSVDLYGNYSIQGPAVIRKINHALVALVQPGGLISVLSSADADPTLMSCASISHDESEAALCTLMGHHLELDGRFVLQDEHEGIEHDGKTIVSVDHLSDDNFITLLPGGSLSHPVNVCPHAR
eukprot:GHUV01002775.1.p1 GENE.GHUV01002775.1~~GHUV01002775.1.p1  ORF type:complete len:222 (+),score=45.12 GHUV01002775.1:144-809(+)